MCIRDRRIEVRSTVGAGDCMVAALTCGFAAGKGLEEAFRMGVAGASAMCMTEGSEPPARADFAALLQTCLLYTSSAFGALPCCMPHRDDTLSSLDFFSTPG